MTPDEGRLYAAEQMPEILAGERALVDSRTLGLILGFRGQPETLAAVVDEVDDQLRRAREARFGLVVR